MEYVKVRSGQIPLYPYDINEFRNENPGTLTRWPPTPAGLADHNIFVVEQTDPPAVTADQVAERAALPTFTNGVWTKQWTVRDRTAEEIEALEFDLLIRIDREAGAFRLRFITDVPGQSATYDAKAAEAQAYAVNPNGSYPFLAAEAQASGLTIAAVAQEIAQTAAAWKALGAGIEGLRMAAKRGVKAATTYGGKLAAAEIDWEALLS